MNQDAEMQIFQSQYLHICNLISKSLICNLLNLAEKMSDIQIDRMVKEIIEVSENGDIFDSLKVICDHDNWHNFKSRLESQ